MIRFILGLLITMGAMGGMDDPANPLLACLVCAVIGLAIMGAGVNALNRKYA